MVILAGGQSALCEGNDFFFYCFHVCLYTKERKNLKYIKVFQRIKFIGKSWYQQTQTVNCLSRRLLFFSHIITDIDECATGEHRCDLKAVAKTHLAHIRVHALRLIMEMDLLVKVHRLE